MPATPDDGLRWIVEDSEARLVLLGGARSTGFSPAPHRRPLATSPASDDSQPLCSPRSTLDAPADLLYTTGTTGRRKGVLLTHENIAQAALNINTFVGTTAEDREVMPLPLAHSFGLGRLRAMALAGHCLLLLPGMRNPAALLKQVLDSAATGLALVPAGFDLILRMTHDRLGDARASLRYVEIGSAPMPPDTRMKLAELLPRYTALPPLRTDGSVPLRISWSIMPTANIYCPIGRPSPNVEMEVRDDEGRDLPDGRAGQIVVRGRTVMREYWKQPDLTRSVLRDGWLNTGDCGRRDADGYYHLTGRQTDVVNVGGRKVNPEEVEEFLNSHPAVVESACAGMPDPQGIVGECLKALVVLRSEVRDEELIDWLRQRLEEFKIPRIWQRVERIAKTESGKVQRHLL